MSTARPATEQLQNAFFWLLKVVSTPALRDWRHDDQPLFEVRDGVYRDNGVPVRISPDVAKAMVNLFSCISPALAESAGIGRHCGERFLSRLAAGDISMKELERGR